MPDAHSRHVKYWLQDHDTDESNQAPPVQNTWYEIFHAQDVRLIWCRIIQTNDETAVKDVEVRWTIDGNVYLVSESMANNAPYYIYRTHEPSAVGTAGLTAGTTVENAALDVDKRGLDFKVEMRITSALGTNQTLNGRCIRETFVET